MDAIVPPRPALTVAQYDADKIRKGPSPWKDGVMVPQMVKYKSVSVILMIAEPYKLGYNCKERNRSNQCYCETNVSDLKGEEKS